ncbi:MAG: hypothetical protein F6K42_11445 [Leptolyngbya sp. SIO1D8]|nr:hypothetical protein [Leptolyngbya sp. SIO1D8]
MLPNLLDNVISPLFDLTITPDQAFLETTSLLDIVSTISPDAATFLTSNLDELETTAGELIVSAGVISGSLIDASGEILLSGDFDAPTFLSEFGETLATASGQLSLVDGFVNTNFQFEDELFIIENFDLATFAADGFSFLLSSVETSIPLENGAFLISADTPFGPINSSIDIAGGDLDLSLETFAGDFDFAIDFGPEDQFPFSVSSPLGDIEAIINLDSGNIEVPLFGNSTDIPLSSLSGELTVVDSIATLDLDTQVGPISTSFEIAPFLNDVVVDTLTGITVDASLAQGQLNLLATQGSEEFQTNVDLVALNDELVATLLETDGGFALGSGVLSGELMIGGDLLTVSQSVDDIAQLLTTPIGDLLTPSPVV